MEKNLGEKIYSRKIISITELENLVGKDKMDEFLEIGVLDLKENSPKVIILEKIESGIIRFYIQPKRLKILKKFEERKKIC